MVAQDWRQELMAIWRSAYYLAKDDGANDAAAGEFANDMVESRKQAELKAINQQS
jgi:hypothetical protein